MVRLFKIIAFFALLLLLGSTNSIAQSVFNQGNATSIYRQLGGAANDKWFKLPNDTTAIYTSANLGKSGAIAFKYPYIYYYDTVATAWIPVISSTGGVDSATVNALISDSLSVVRDSLNNKQDKLGYDVLGFIYNKNTWANPDTSLFYRNANVGTFMDTSVDANGDYVIVGGVNLHTSGGAVMSVKALAVFQKWSMFARFVVKNVDANSTGLAVGTTYGHMQLHTSTDVDSGGKLSFWANQFHQTLSTLAIPIAENDTVSVQIIYDGYNVFGKAVNYTQDTMITLEYSYINGGDLAASTVTPTYNLYSLGSSNDIVIDSLCVHSHEIKNADLFVMGDSKVWRYDANSVTNCFTYRLLEHFPYSGSSGLSGLSLSRFTTSVVNGVTISSGLDELIRLKPKQLIFELYSNTLRATSDTTTFWTDYSAIIDRLQDSGIVTYHLPMHETVAGMNFWKETFFLKELYKNYPDYIFNGITPLLDCSNCLDAGGIHLNQRGNDIVYDLILYDGKLNNVNYPPNQTWVTGNYWTLFGKIPYSQYDGSFNASSDFNSPSLTFNLLPSGKHDTLVLPIKTANIKDTIVLFERLRDTAIAIRAAIPSVSGYVPTSRTISATTPLSGGGDLSANRTLTIDNALADGATKGAASFTAADFNATAGNVSIDYTNGQAATTALKGFLTNTDWNTFNNKLSSSAISGTNNTIVKFTSASTIGNSSFTDNGTIVNMTLPLNFDFSTTDYRIGNRAGSLLSIEAMTSGQPQQTEYFTADGDGTDNNGFAIFAVGTRAATTNFEQLFFRYLASSTKYVLGTNQGGTGVSRDFSLGHGANPTNITFPAGTQKVEIGSGIVANGGGMKHSRVTTGSIGAASSALVTITWGSAFADANYTVSASVTDATAATAALRVVHVESVTSSAVTVRVENTSAGSLTGTVNVIAVHD